MMVREPSVAGRFYPQDRRGCLEAIEAMHRPREFPDVPDRPVGGVVPHAGWLFSGETALAVFAAIESRRRPVTFVIFGTPHRPVPGHVLFPEGAWHTPLGPVEVDGRLAEEVLGRAGAEGLLEADPVAHEGEHSIEVQLPLLQYLFADFRIVPILAVADATAPLLGRIVGQAIRDRRADAVVIGSSDLTHYGPMYGFAPKGLGEAALRWVREENDRRMIDLMLALKAEEVIDEARTHLNACGAGAIAATLAAARVLGATRGVLVQYTTSHDALRQRMGRADYDAVVGYPGVVF